MPCKNSFINVLGYIIIFREQLGFIKMTFLKKQITAFHNPGLTVNYLKRHSVGSLIMKKD